MEWLLREGESTQNNEKAKMIQSWIFLFVVSRYSAQTGSLQYEINQEFPLVKLIQFLSEQ